MVDNLFIQTMQLFITFCFFHGKVSKLYEMSDYGDNKLSTYVIKSNKSVIAGRNKTVCRGGPCRYVY